MIFRLYFLLILIVGFELSCSTGPEFERTNENDPISNNFKPDSPKSNTSNIYVNNEKQVVLSWPDARFEEGYILKKRINNDNQFLEIARLDSNVTSYTDSSKILSTSTQYELLSYSIREDSINISSNPLKFSLTFDPISNFYLSTKPDNEGTISWNFSNRDSIGTRYFDAILIEINKSSLNDNWQIIDTLKRAQFDTKSSASFSFPDNLFDLRIRISQIPVLNELDNTSIKTSTFRENYNSPTNVSASIINEVDFTIDWDSPFQNYDRALLKEGSTIIDTIYNFSSPYEFTYKGENNRYRYFGIQLVKDENFSKTVYIGNSDIPVFVTKPAITRVEPISETSLKLFWEPFTGNQENIEKKFIIERKKETENSFSILDSVDKNNTSYIHDDLEKNSSYNFRIRSVISAPSKEATFGYRTTLDLNEVTEYEFPGIMPEFSESGNLEARYNSDNYTLYIFNKAFSTNQKIIFGPEIHQSARQNILVEYELGKNDSLIAYIIADNFIEGRYSLEIYNHLTNKVIFNTGGELSTYYSSLQFTNDGQLVFISRNNTGYTLNKLSIDNLQLDSRTINDYYGGMVLKNENALICSGSGIYSIDLKTESEINLDNTSCSNIFKDMDTGVIYFYSLINHEVYSFDTATNTVNLITKVPSEVDIEPYHFKYIPNLNMIIYNRARLKNKSNQFSTSLIQNLDINSYSFYIHQQTDLNRGTIPLQITFDSTNSEIIMYMYSGIYNYDKTEGWARLN